MIRFLFKGVIRDKSRSLLPVIVVALGVFLTVFMSAFFKGVITDIIEMTANYSSGHVKVTTRAYEENADQAPVDLAIIGVAKLKDKLREEYPDMDWYERIRSGGLLDVPDGNGETQGQGPAVVTAIDLLTPGSTEVERMNIRNSIVKGELPKERGEVLISDDFAEKFGVTVGDDVTLFGSTMNGSMAFQNFKVSGTLRFGNSMLDRGAIFMDLKDAQLALDMEDSACEILGYYRNAPYMDLEAKALASSYNNKYSKESDEFSPKMTRLAVDAGMGDYLSMADNLVAMMSSIFIVAMSIVLWNTGLLGGLRRYSEFGVRLALGEEKKHIYMTTLYEAVFIGIIGSVIGTVFGLALSYYLQYYGWDFSALTGNIGMMLPSVFRAEVTPSLLYVGFIPGVIATVLGSALAGFAIYKRKTAQLFHELEV
jgi:putative ABC transport system permease protein